MIQRFRPAILFLILCVLATAPVLAGNPESLGRKAEKAGKYSQALKHYTAAIQKTSPGSLRERKLQKKIIGIVRKMKRTPPLPEKVDRHLARGEAFVETAKDKSGFGLAIREFRAATRMAPWLGQAYYNLGVVQEKAGRHDASMESFRMYLFASPNAPDARKVKRLIYKIEARKEAAKAQEAQRRNTERRQREARLRRDNETKDRKYQSLAGTWCLENAGAKYCTYRMTVNGNSFELKEVSRGQTRRGITIATRSVLRGKIHPNGEISGSYVSGLSDSRFCGGRTLYAPPTQLKGRLMAQGKRIFSRFRSYAHRPNRNRCALTRNTNYPPQNTKRYFSRR